MTPEQRHAAQLLKRGLTLEHAISRLQRDLHLSHRDARQATAQVIKAAYQARRRQQTQGPVLSSSRVIEGSPEGEVEGPVLSKAEGKGAQP